MSLDTIFQKAENTTLSRPDVYDLARALKDHGDPAPLVDRALRAGKTRTATVLLLAGCATGHAPRPALMLLAYPRIYDLLLAIALSLQIRDNLVDFFLDVAESGACSWEREAMALWAAASLSPRGPKPRRLLVAIRLLSRRDLGEQAAALILAAARRCDSEALEVVFERWGEFGEEAKLVSITLPIRRMAEKSPIDLLSVQPVPEEAGEFAGVLANLSRNAPCPCGSEKKYKRCCGASGSLKAGRLDDTALASMMDVEEFYTLRPSSIVGLDFERLPLPHLVGTVRRLGEFRLWDDAERAFEALSRRDALPGGSHPDDYLEDLLLSALDAGDPAVVRRIMSGFSSEDRIDPVARFELELLDGHGGPLDHAEDTARRALEDKDSHDASELAHVLCRHRPALGILVARGQLLDPPSPLEAYSLTESISEARDRLLAEPYDLGMEKYLSRFFDDGVDDPEEQEGTERERDRLKEQVDEANRRIGTLEEELAKLDPATTRPAEDTGRQDKGGRADPEDLARLRLKIETFKARISEGQAERLALRRRLHRLSEKGAKKAEETAPEEREDPDEEDIESDLDSQATRKTRIPVFTPAAEKAIRNAREGVGRRALLLASSLCAGDSGAWRGVKKLTGVRDLRSARVGRTRRLLFLETDDDRLHFEAFLERRDLETYIRQRP